LEKLLVKAVKQQLITLYNFAQAVESGSD